jgi:hypothetical protein
MGPLMEQVRASIAEGMTHDGAGRGDG